MAVTPFGCHMAVDPAPNRFRDLMVDDEPSLDEVMTCVFGIQAHEVRTYRTLLATPGSTVERRRRLLDGGGHVYQYTATPLEQARELMHETLDQWTEAVHDRIDAFEAADGR